jgi:DNA-binding response OmpR family regulator
MIGKVLVVDDEEQIRDLFRTVLTAIGYEVNVASSGEEAIELATSVDPDVVILDLNMPGIGGLETCSRLRAEDKTSLVPIIVLTGFGAREMETSQAGADDYVNKPVSIADLSMRIQSVVKVGHITDPAERLMTYLDELERNRSE